MYPKSSWFKVILGELFEILRWPLAPVSETVLCLELPYDHMLPIDFIHVHLRLLFPLAARYGALVHEVDH